MFAVLRGLTAPHNTLMALPLGAAVSVATFGNKRGVVIAATAMVATRCASRASRCGAREEDLSVAAEPRKKKRTEALRRFWAVAPPVSRRSAWTRGRSGAGARVDEIDGPLLRGADRVEVVHGKGSGRIRTAPPHLASMTVVVAFRLDPRTPASHGSISGRSTRGARHVTALVHHDVAGTRITGTPCWLKPSSGRARCPRPAATSTRGPSTSLLECTVSPSNSGLGSRTSSQPRFARRSASRSDVLTGHQGQRETGVHRRWPNSVALAYSPSKWIRMVFIVMPKTRCCRRRSPSSPTGAGDSPTVKLEDRLVHPP